MLGDGIGCIFEKKDKLAMLMEEEIARKRMGRADGVAAKGARRV